MRAVDEQDAHRRKQSEQDAWTHASDRHWQCMDAGDDLAPEEPEQRRRDGNLAMAAAMAAALAAAMLGRPLDEPPGALREEAEQAAFRKRR